MAYSQAKPAGQPRTLRTIAEGKIQQKNLAPDPLQTPEQYADEANALRIRSLPAVAQKTPIK